MTDEKREELIREIGEAIVHCDSRAARAILWVEMMDLIKQRSAAQIAKMEQDKGLR